MHARFLLRVGHEEVLAQYAPVEESAGVVDLADLQEGKFTHTGVGHVGGGDDAVLGILVDEYVDVVAGCGAFGHETRRQKYLGAVAAVEVDAEVDGLDYPEGVVLSYFYHNGAKLVIFCGFARVFSDYFFNFAPG